jgi:hypothetical protein
MGGIGPNNAGYAIIVGQQGGAIADDIRLDFAMSDCGSATQNGGAGIGALFIANLQNSHLNIETSNQLAAIGGTHKIAIHTGVSGDVDTSSVLVTGTIDGVPHGVIAAGATIGGAAVAVGGSGYAIGDIVTANSSGPIINATFLVTGVSSGAVTSLKLLGPGLYSTLPVGYPPLTTTAATGHGSGHTIYAGYISPAGTIGCGIAIRDGSMPGWVRDYGICEIFGTGAPTTTTGQHKALKGSKYTDLSAGEYYINKGTSSSPAWHKITTA